jgi:hypothetical protein
MGPHSPICHPQRHPALTSRLSPLAIRVRPRFPFCLSGGTLTAGGECPNEKVIDSFPVDLCPADHSGLSRSWLFKVRYPAPFPFLFYNFEPKYCPQPGYEKAYSKDYYYYRPSSTCPWADPRACRAIVIPGV